MRSPIAVALALALSLPLPAAAQGPQTDDEADALKIGVELVQVDVVVTDKDGRRAEGLVPEDFEIYEDGKPQEITNFSFVKGTVKTDVAPRPGRQGGGAAPPARALRTEEVRRVFALVVDDLFLSFEAVPWTKTALRRFVDEQMQEGDLVAVILTSKGTGSLQQFTSDKRLLYAAIDRVRWNMRGAKGPTVYEGYGQDIAEFGHKTRGGADAPPARPGAAGERRPALVENAKRDKAEILAGVSLGALDYVSRSMRELPGRKSLVWFTEGFPLVSAPGKGQTRRETRILDMMRDVAERTTRAGVVMYPIDAGGLHNPLYEGVDPDRYIVKDTARLYEPSRTDVPTQNYEKLEDPESVMYYMAYATGGLVYAGNEPAVGLRRVVGDQDSYYFIGYVPEKASFEPANGKPKFHEIDVRVKRPGLTVRSRSGFLGYEDPARADGGGASPAARLARAMLSPVAAGAIDIGLTAQTIYEGPKELLIRSTLRVDASDLTFKDAGAGKSSASFDVVAFATEEKGGMEGVVYETKTMTVPAAEAERLRRQGLVFVIDLPIKKYGPYQVRAAVRDAATERIGSASEFVVVPDLSARKLAVSGAGVSGMTAGALAGFRPGDELTYFFAVYNAKTARPSNAPSLRMKIALWRDGRKVFEGPEGALPVGQQSDWKRVNAVGSFRLSPKTAPGVYTLQIDVVDANATGPEATATQWVDFDVAPADAGGGR